MDPVHRKNSAVFGLQSANVKIDAFLAALSIQYPEAIGGVDTQQISVKGTVVAVLIARLNKKLNKKTIAAI